MRPIAIVLVGVLLLAGCSGGPTTVPEPTDTSTFSPTPTAESSPTPTEYEPSPTATPDPYPSNYWDEQQPTVAIDTTNASNDRNYTAMVREAAAYWRVNSEQYAGYPIDLTVDPDASNPDIIVRIQKEIETCGLDTNTDRATGCASLISTWNHPTRPEVMQIRAGFTSNSTADTMKHEFGHLLGLSHGNEPMPLMNASHERSMSLSLTPQSGRTHGILEI